MAGWLSEDPLGYSMFEMTSLYLQTLWHLWSSLINCLVDDTLWNARPRIDKALLQASCVVDCGLVGLISLLHHSPNTIVDWDQNFKSGLFDGQGSGVMYLYTWRSGATTSRTRWACRRVDLLEHESAARNMLRRMQHLLILLFQHHTHVGLVVAVKLDPWLEQTLLCRHSNWYHQWQRGSTMQQFVEQQCLSSSCPWTHTHGRSFHGDQLSVVFSTFCFISFVCSFYISRI